MTTLTFDLSELDEELGDLLAHRWAVCLTHSSLRLPRRGDPTEPKVIAPPPSSTVLIWEFSAPCSVVGAALVLIAVALLFLLGKWGYRGYLWLWRHA